MLNDPVLMNDWHVVARSEDLQEGQIASARLLGEDLVVWRRDGQTLVWQDLCIHRGTRLSLGSVEEQGLMCPYHGWTFNTEGRCVHIPAHPDQVPPAKARVKVYRAVERYGLVWASLGEPDHDVPLFPEWDDPEFRKILCGPYRYHAGGPRAIENFLDISHFPFVHEGLLGDRSETRIDDYEVAVGPNGIRASGIRVWQPDPDGTGHGGYVTYTYDVLRPLTAAFSKVSEGPRYAILMTVTPVEEIESIAWMWLAVNYGHDLPEEEFRTFQDRIVAQDVPVVESQRPERLPLDLQAELHLRSDRTAIAYRRWLNELGLTFGTA